MNEHGNLVLGCCTAILDRPLFARLSVLQVAAQTLHPHFHSIVAAGVEFDGRFIDDLMDESTLFTHLSEPVTTLGCYTHGINELLARGADLIFCLDHDCVYRRDYLASICGYVQSSGLDIQDGMFCLNLIDQYWITLFDNARAVLEPHDFHQGLGLTEEEAQRVVVGAPPTFVFGSSAAQIVAARANQEQGPENGYHDIFWRRTLLDAGIAITQVRTPEPVFAYVRHTNNLCWGGAPVESPGGVRHAGPVLVPPPSRKPRNPRRVSADGSVDVSVVVPSYNEGEWLSRTVESIRDAETDLCYEIIVVDDGCSDGSVQSLVGGDELRTVQTGGEQLGLIVAKNIGAKAARGRYICFVDSHVIVHDHWLDYLRETCDAYPQGALVSGNLPDVARYSSPEELDQHQYGYTIRNCLLGTGWHFYGCPFTDRPYSSPLTPGGLMFTRKLHFARLSGFAPMLRKWGSEDVQISLHNYYSGGENIVDPRVVVYHYYKNGHTKKRSFTVSNGQQGFNSLHVAAAYFPPEYYCKVRDAITARGGAKELPGEIESRGYQRLLRAMRSEFVRGFDEWTTEFRRELRRFLRDAEERAGSAVPADAAAAPQLVVARAR